MTPSIVPCRLCAFWITTNLNNGHCKRRAPRPAEGADEIAFWPETFAAEGCGDGMERDTAPRVVACSSCVFWRRSPHDDGIYPVDRHGAPIKWWKDAGRCVRFAPGASSDSSRHGFWRVTNRSDSCGEGVCMTPATPPASA